MPDSATSAGQQAAILTAEEVYDMLMGAIEPELLTENIPRLDERYADETAEERQERYERYAKAYEAFDAAFAQWSLALQTDVTAFRRAMQQDAETKNTAEEANAIASLEAAMRDAALPSPNHA